MALREQEKQERIREARRRLSAQRNRAGQLRGRVIAASLICFALLWGVVFVQMATGNDPVLGEKTAAGAPKPKRHRGASAQSQQPASEREAEPAPEIEAEPAPEIEAEPAPEFEAEPESEIEAEPEPEPEIQPEVEVQPEEEVELEPLTTSQS